MQKKIKVVLYLLLIVAVVLGIMYFLENVGPKLIIDLIIWLGEDAVI